MSAIRRLINDNTPQSTITVTQFMAIAGGRERVNRQGKMSKRIKRNLFREYGIKLSDEVVQQIGNLMDQNSLSAREYMVEYTTDFEGTVGNFGDYGSCFRPGHEYEHHLWAMHKLAGQEPGNFSAVRVYRASGSRLARAWVYHAHDGAAVLFNGYGIPLDKIALLASKLDDIDPRLVELYGDLCINWTTKCEALGGTESSYRVNACPEW
jgi:hypothetical protein